MRATLLIPIVLCAALPLVGRAQTSTNPPPTEIQNFDLQTDVVIIKGVREIGTVATEAGTIGVESRESDNVANGQKQYALSLLFGNNQGRIMSPVDYDELDSLIQSLDYLSKVTYEVTPMPAFDAIFTTRSGFRAGAHSQRRQGSIQLYVQFPGLQKIMLTPDQFAQLQSLINQAKSSLDTQRSKN